MDVIEVQGISKSYGDTRAVDDISLSVAEGEIFGIVGPNGAGKTTTVEAVAGLRRVDSGRISVLGLDPIGEGGALRQRLGIQLQHAALQDRLRVWEALDLYASFYERSADHHELIAAWGLEEKRGAAFSTLSGGQKQRLFIALALVNEPEVVIFDELTTGLDPQARHATWDLVRQVRDDRGTTVVLVTHSMEEAERLCDRVAIVEQGKLAALGTPRELIRRFAPGLTVRFTDAGGFDPAWLEQVRSVEYTVREGSEVVVSGSGALMSQVAVALAVHGHNPPDLRSQEPTLEDVFINLTGDALRD